MPYDPTPWRERFWAHVPSGLGVNECWEWTGHRNTDGYGRISIEGQARGAHRVMAGLQTGPVPDGMHVCHTCDNPPCVNPLHLFVGTAKDNARDRQDKGRFTPPRFDRDQHPRAKLTTDQVRSLVARHRGGRGGNTAELAARYDISIRHLNKLTKEHTK